MQRRDGLGERRGWVSLVIHALASSRLALVLVSLLILFSLAGATLPQEGLTKAAEVAEWQDSHALLTSLARPLGLFHVFSSGPFLATIVLLGINTLTCTVLHFLRDGGVSGFRRPGALRRAGFLLLHLSLPGLFAGGFWSAAARLDGFILLTEGQSFTESHDGYARLLEAPLRPESHREFSTTLKKVRIRYEADRFPVEIASELEFTDCGKEVAREVVRVNHPVAFRGISFTQDKTGYSPRLVIRKTRTGATVLDSFVALQTFGGEGEREYRDYLPVPCFSEQVVLSLYPSHSRAGDTVVKSGESPESPLLVVETVDPDENVLSRQHLPLGEELTVGEFTLSFTDLRLWSTFRVAEDPGYPLVVVSLWLGVIALILRYIQELWRWLADETDIREVGKARTGGDEGHGCCVP